MKLIKIRGQIIRSLSQNKQGRIFILDVKTAIIFIMGTIDIFTMLYNEIFGHWFYNLSKI